MYRSEDVFCQQIGSILGGEATFENGICTVAKPRNMQVTILGRPSKAVANLEFSFESFDQTGLALCLAELVLLQEEIQPICNILTKYNLQISALHNHWIYTNPTILYLHFQSVDYPQSFASKASEITKILR
ncbi:MAG: DUF1259 domain-containing protein [Candidatus Cohnella colombiensis]|uniref:DUF1259 domain-containing protein n=1 Tax=Candidatus Cohnella colombiensis TaxID=3121368 RepID=A0AA95F1A4_9BACL|nr:MAG: DUF1259 domain-containing protein [Cohnella sp.]